jgi:hypothetical protein
MGREIISRTQFGVAAELLEEAAEARDLASMIYNDAAVRDLLAYAAALETAESVGARRLTTTYH